MDAVRVRMTFLNMPSSFGTCVRGSRRACNDDSEKGRCALSSRTMGVPVTMNVVRRRECERGSEPGKNRKRRPPSVRETCRRSRDPPKERRARERHDDLRGNAGDEQMLVDEISERRARCDALHDLLAGERARLHDGESHREHEPTVRLFI